MKRKRIIAIVLSSALLISVGGVVAYASGENETYASYMTSVDYEEKEASVEPQYYPASSMTIANDELPEDIANDKERNVSMSETKTLLTGQSFSKEFDLNKNWLWETEHNRVSVVFSDVTGPYLITLVETNTNQVICDGERHEGNYPFTIVGNPGNRFKITVSNPYHREMKFTLTMTSYYSN